MEDPSPEWSDDDERRLHELAEAQYGGESLRDYILRVSPHHPPPRHISPLLELWDRTRYERVFACVSLPPQHIKTITGLHGLTWRMARDPALVHGFATFGDGYAASKSRMARGMALRGGVQLSKDMANLHEWRTVEGGGLLAHGYRGEWTGQSITGVGLVDDPFKDRADAESAKIRENVWDWFGDVFWTRMNPGSSVIVQHTRWHDDDLIGRLLAGKFAGYSFEEIRLPAIAEDGDLLGRAPGEALWPEQYDEDELGRREASLGPYGWASLYQQRPRPRGADVFVEPARFQLASWRPDGHRILITADPAATESTRADYSAYHVLAAKGHHDQMTVDVLHSWRGQVSVPAFARRLVEASRRFWNAPVVVEAVGGFKAVPQMLRELEPGLRLRIAHMGMPDQGDVAPARVSNAPADKFLRAQPAAAAWNSGRIRIPVDAECEWDGRKFAVPPGGHRRLRAGVAPNITWADEMLAEARKFTGVGDAQDDQIDALAHGWNELMGARQSKRGQQRNSNPFG